MAIKYAKNLDDIIVPNSQSSADIPNQLTKIRNFLYEAPYEDRSALAKSQFGSNLAPEELESEIKNPNSEINKYLNEMLLTIIKIALGQEAYRAFLEFEQRKGVAASTDAEREELSYKQKQNIIAANLAEAVQRSNEFGKGDNVTAYQKLQQQKLNEMSFWMQRAPDAKTLKHVRETLDKVFELREKNLDRAADLAKEAKGTHTTSARRAEIESHLEALETHNRLSDPKMMERIIPEIVNDPTKQKQAINRVLLNEQFYEGLLNKKFSKKNTSDEDQRLAMEMNKDLVKKLPLVHGFISEKHPDLTPLEHSRIIGLLSDAQEQVKNPDPERQVFVESGAYLLFRRIEEDPKYHSLTNCLKTYLEKKMPINDWREKYGDFQHLYKKEEKAAVPPFLSDSSGPKPRGPSEGIDQEPSSDQPKPKV